MPNAEPTHYRHTVVLLTPTGRDAALIADAFERFGLKSLIGPDHLFHSVEEALTALTPDSAIAAAEARQRLR